MMPLNMVYCRPETLAEAADVYAQLQKEGKNPVYYAGGSEVITMSRAGAICPGAVIDIKSIPRCMELSRDERALHIGSACTLNQIKESGLFPFLGLACGRIADHTNQCRITLGGNLCGSIIYRETSLPLLLSDAEITLFGEKGERTVSFESVFDGRMRLFPGEMIIALHVPVWALDARHFHVKRTRNEKMDYPLVSMAALCKYHFLRAAFSGVCPYPFRSGRIETVINNRAASCRERAENAALYLPEPPPDSAEGASDYKQFVFINTVQTLLEEWESGKI